MAAARDPASPVAQAPPPAPTRRIDNPAPPRRALATWRWLPMALVAALTVIGLALRLKVAHQSLVADELSTYWIVTTHGFTGVISTVHSNAEITPPLYFVLAWLTSQLGHAPELVRAPSLLAGLATIPASYLLGRRTVGRSAALAATAIVALAPFTIYYSAEARSYGLTMALVVLSTLTMLVAVDTCRTRWWIVYGACSCAAVYSHYTSVFALGAQLLWLLWACPGARRQAILANLGAVVLFLPWTTGVINDFTSPTSNILSALSPFTPHDVADDLVHWSIAYPYAHAPLHRVPGTLALILVLMALLVAFTGVATAAVSRDGRPWRLPDRRLILILALALSAPVGEAVLTVFGTNLFGVRNLAASWPALALLVGVLLTRAGPRLGLVATALAIVGFSLAAVRMVEPRNHRADYRAAADFVERHALRGDVILDESAALSPGPLSALDVALGPGHRVLRALAPAESDHPFGFFDPVVSPSVAVPRAIAAAGGGRIFLVQNIFDRAALRRIQPDRRQPTRFPPSYRVIREQRFVGVRVRVYAERRASPR